MAAAEATAAQMGALGDDGGDADEIGRVPRQDGAMSGGSSTG
jgi:hypothetical protein